MYSLLKKSILAIVKLVVFTIICLVFIALSLRVYAQTQAKKAATTLSYLVQGEGCYNQDVKESFEASLLNMYGNLNRSDTNGDGVIDEHDDYWINFYTNCTDVTKADGTSVYNTNANSYLNHVARGDVLRCTVNVTVNYKTPFGVFMVGTPIHFNDTYSASVDTISTRFFKGDAP